MECPKCGRMVPEERQRCLYCGAGVATASPATGRASKKDEVPSPEGQSRDRIVVTSEVNGEERTYVSLDHLPESLRKEVVEALRTRGKEAVIKGDGPIAAGVPEGRERPDETKAAPNLPPGFRTAEEYIEHQLTLIRSQRKAPLNKLVLSFILFASMAFGGLVVWLLR